MTDMHVSWEEYHRKTEELAIKVSDDKYEFKEINKKSNSLTLDEIKNKLLNNRNLN